VISNVHFEFFAEPSAFPVGKEVSIVIEMRAAAEVNVTDQHAAEMANVAYAVACGANRPEKLDGAHHDDKDPHGHGDRQREEPDLPMWHHNRHR